MNYLDEFIKKKVPTKIFVFVDQNTKRYCLPIFMEQIKSSNRFLIIEVDKFKIYKYSESLKSMEVVTKICQDLLRQDIDKNSLICFVLINTFIR